MRNNGCCNVCFSNNHFMNKCNSKRKEFILFPPKIDVDLFSRFTQILTLEEKYLFIFTFPNVYNSITVQPLFAVRTNEMNFLTATNFMDADLIIFNKVFPQNCLSDLPPRISTITFRVQHLELISPFHRRGRLHLYPQDLLHLLSTAKKSLKCKGIAFIQNLTFKEVLGAGSNLEDIDIYQTNIEVEDSWIDLLDGKENVRNVSLTIAKFNVNVEKLAALIKKRHNSIKINLYIIYPPIRHTALQHQDIMQIDDMLSSHFVLSPFSTWNTLAVSFRYANGDIGKFYKSEYGLKDV